MSPSDHVPSQISPTPLSLLQKLRASADRQAWNRFVDLYYPFIYGKVRSGGLKSNDAADVVQNIFVKLLENIPKFNYDPNRRFRAWLGTVARNELVNWRREGGTIQGRTGPLEDEPAVGDPCGEFDRKEYHAYLAGRGLEVMRADFEEKTWKACWKVVVENRPREDVAKELNMSADSVYQACRRVLVRLRAELKGLWEEE